jgi:hypothetical protein
MLIWRALFAVSPLDFGPERVATRASLESAIEQRLRELAHEAKNGDLSRTAIKMLQRVANQAIPQARRILELAKHKKIARINLARGPSSNQFCGPRLRTPNTFGRFADRDNPDHSVPKPRGRSLIDSSWNLTEAQTFNFVGASHCLT